MTADRANSTAEDGNAAIGTHTIALSLVSHTNAGKTTLARTLLGEDVGDIRDESHVTEFAEQFTLAETSRGDRLELWDTPGFGDSARLAQRLGKADNPVGWLIGQVWDRFNDRAMYSSQQAIRHVREQADVVLYLVNAAEDPEDAAYVAPEMQILSWIGKPVLVLLNQMGPPRPAEQEAQDIARWRSHLETQSVIRHVLALDAFARCWVQEGVLLDAVTSVLPANQQPAYERLRTQWLTERQHRFEQSIGLLSASIAEAATDIERIADTGLLSTVRDAGAAIGLGSSDTTRARDTAMIAMAERWDRSHQETTDKLIALHGLGGHASQQVLTRVDAHYAVNRKLHEGKAAVVGGVATGALAGLKADIASGGMTLGGGMIAGGILGALGAAGLARGYNMVRGINAIVIQWSDAVLLNKVNTALLTYLAVAHFGRGRGNWERSEYPPHWLGIVEGHVEQNKARYQKCWKQRQQANAADGIRSGLTDLLNESARDVLTTLYPDASRMLNQS